MVWELGRGREIVSINDSKPSVFIVTGMHRSGTSLTASLFQKVGVDIGKKLVGPADGNVRSEERRVGKEC